MKVDINFSIMVTEMSFVRIFFLWSMLLSVICIDGFAQSTKQESEDQVMPRLVGRHYQRQENISGKEILVEGYVRHLYADSITKTVSVQLDRFSRKGVPQGSGILFVWDTEKERSLWHCKINSDIENLSPVQNVLFLTSDFKTRCFDRRSGKEHWNDRGCISYVDQKLGVGIRCKDNLGSTEVSKLEGINLYNGKKIWERKIFSQQGWADMLPLNDSVILLLSDALYALNMKNGEGWRHEIFLKELPFPKAEKEFMQRFTSNILIEKEKIYIASCDRLFCLDHTGKVLWLQGVSRKITGESQIFTMDSSLYMVNYGSGLVKGSMTKKWGIPYVAKFNKNTGFQEAFSSFPTSLGIVNHVQVSKDTLYVLFDQHLIKLSSSDLARGIQVEFSLDKDRAGYFASNRIFVLEDSRYKTLQEMDSTRCYILTGKQNILCVKADVQGARMLLPSEYCLCYLTYQGYSFLSRGEETIVIAPSGELWAHLRISKNAVRVGNKLYDAQENKITIVDLDEVIH